MRNVNIDEKAVNRNRRNYVLSNNKGQAAIEYLMNYAWAIALIIIVAVAIFTLNLGDISISLSGSGSGLSQQFEQVALIGHRWAVADSTKNDTLTIAVQNNGANQITINRINLTEIDGSAVTKIVQNISSVTLFPGETAARILHINKTDLGITKRVNQEFKVKIAINYTDTETTVSYQPERTLRGKSQTE